MVCFAQDSHRADSLEAIKNFCLPEDEFLRDQANLPELIFVSSSTLGLSSETKKSSGEYPLGEGSRAPPPRPCGVLIVLKSRCCRETSARASRADMLCLLPKGSAGVGWWTARAMLDGSSAVAEWGANSVMGCAWLSTGVAGHSLRRCRVRLSMRPFGNYLYLISRWLTHSSESVGAYLRATTPAGLDISIGAITKFRASNEIGDNELVRSPAHGALLCQSGVEGWFWNGRSGMETFLFAWTFAQPCQARQSTP